MPKNSNRALRRANRARIIKNRSASKHYDGCVAVQLPDGKLAKNHYIPDYGTCWKDAKDWNLLWSRSQKRHRARQLGFEHRKKNWRDLEDLREEIR